MGGEEVGEEVRMLEGGEERSVGGGVDFQVHDERGGEVSQAVGRVSPGILGPV